jgi:hypothetical protein
MRLAVIALLAVTFSGAAWAGSAQAARNGCESHSVTAESIADSVEASFEQALDALEGADLHTAVLAEIEAEMDYAMSELEVELAALDGEMEALSAEHEAEVEARIEAALERMEIALEHGDYDEDRFERVGPPDAPKRWRPRY